MTYDGNILDSGECEERESTITSTVVVAGITLANRKLVQLVIYGEVIKLITQPLDGYIDLSCCEVEQEMFMKSVSS